MSDAIPDIQKTCIKNPLHYNGADFCAAEELQNQSFGLCLHLFIYEMSDSIGAIDDLCSCLKIEYKIKGLSSDFG